MAQVTKIILPNNPHLDPIAAYWILYNYGREQLPGIETAGLSVWKNGENPSTQQLAQWEAQGIISFDIAGGTFDHHNTGKTTTLLVAEALGVADNPELQALLRYVHEDDLAGLHNNFGDLAGIIKYLYKQGLSIEGVVKSTLRIIDALQHKEHSWFIGAKEEYERKAHIVRVKRGRSRLKVAVIESDNLDVANYAKQHDNVAVVVQRNARGHVFIFTHKMFRVDLRPVVGAIRLREHELANKPVKEPAALYRPGKTLDIQHWFYHDSLNALMNGSAALAQTPPTELAFDEIIGIVVYGVGTDYPASEHQPERYSYYQELFSKLPAA